MENKSQTFESSLERLEEIVRSMERGETPLDETIALFEEGTKLAEQCNNLLNAAEMKVLLITRGSDGEPVEEVFNGDKDI